jgi:hypothetical protein
MAIVPAAPIKTAAAPTKAPAPTAKKVKVRADALIWNGHTRIRPGTVFEVPEGTKLPKCCTVVEDETPEEVTLGKRERGAEPTNLVKDQTGK